MRAVLVAFPSCGCRVLWWLAVLAGLWFGGPAGPVAARAATGPESRAYTNALKSFQGQVWDLADKDFGLFTEKFPESAWLGEAILLQAQARIQARRATAAAELLRANAAQAGRLADEYCFWLGEALLAATNLPAAVAEFERLGRDFADSPRRGEAAYSEALARSQLEQWPAVATLLGAPEGNFQTFARAQPGHRATVGGRILLAEALVRLRRPDEVAAALAPLADQTLSPRREWERRYWLTRADLAAGRVPAALVEASNTLAAATTAARADLLGPSRELLAELLAESERPAEAVLVLEGSLATNAPAASRRPALFKIVGLMLKQGQVEEAGQRLNDFIKLNPEDGASPAFLVALGELKLRQHLAGAASTNAPDTNRLDQAVRLFEAALTNAPPGSLVRGQAELLRGWGWWLSGRTNESRAAFAAAVEALPVSAAQAVARFKLADAALQLGDPATALTNYTAVVEGYRTVPGVSGRFREQALYQLLRASLELNDRATATRTLEQMLALTNSSARAGGGLLLVGEKQLAEDLPRQARESFAEFARRFPDSPQRADAELGLARAAEREGRWDEALGIYAAWLTNWPAHPAQPLAEYALALATAQAGQATNAFLRFTNFLARYPTNELAAFAQDWLADFHFRQGDFKAAEEGYQILFQQWPASPLAGEAQMMAGRAAAARLETADARKYFTGLINASNSPPELVARALFALGDITARSESTETNKPQDNFVQAIGAFRKLQQLYPTNDLAVLAEVRVGDCYLQLASTNNFSFHTNAAAAYSNVLGSAVARVAARSQAEVGLGAIREKQARLLPPAEQPAVRLAALEHYLNVAYQRNLRPGEAAEPFWVKRAALDGARLAEELQLWPAVVTLYEQLGKMLPVLQPGLEAKLQKAREQIPR